MLRPNLQARGLETSPVTANGKADIYMTEL